MHFSVEGCSILSFSFSLALVGGSDFGVSLPVAVNAAIASCTRSALLGVRFLLIRNRLGVVASFRFHLVLSFLLPNLVVQVEAR